MQIRIGRQKTTHQEGLGKIRDFFASRLPSFTPESISDGLLVNILVSTSARWLVRTTHHDLATFALFTEPELAHTESLGDAIRALERVFRSSEFSPLWPTVYGAVADYFSVVPGALEDRYGILPNPALRMRHAEIGCGFRGMGFVGDSNVILVDNNPHTIEFLRYFAERKDVPLNAFNFDILSDSPHSIPAVDRTSCSFLLHCLDVADIPSAIRFMQSLLIPGGTLNIEEPALNCCLATPQKIGVIRTILHAFFAHVVEKVSFEQMGPYFVPTHVFDASQSRSI